MANAYFLGERDRNALAKVTRKVLRSGASSLPPSAAFVDDPGAPDVYIIRAIDPEDPEAEPAIPARDGITLGYWEHCAVYKVVEITEGVQWDLEQVFLDDDELEPYLIAVYNIEESELPWDYYVAVREKSGSYIVQAGSGGGGAFVLAEDCIGAGSVYAWPATFNAETGATTIVPDSEPFKLGHQESSLSSPKSAKAGYKGQWKSIDGQRVFDFGPCIDGCQTSSSISPGSPPDGEVGTAYEHTVSVSGLSEDGVSSPNLPAGLTIDPDTGDITGTPTAAGTFFVTFTADSDDDPPCPITKMAKIVIAPDSDPEPDPETPP